MMAVTQNNHDVSLFFFGWEFLSFKADNSLKKKIFLGTWKSLRRSSSTLKIPVHAVLLMKHLSF